MRALAYPNAASCAVIQSTTASEKPFTRVHTPLPIPFW
jgi:hypothetical protein